MVASLVSRGLDKVRALVGLDEVPAGKVLDDIPDSIKAEGIRLPPLVHQLIGRTRQHPSAGDVGKALRRLGWRRKRDWSNGDEGYPAVWYPPNSQV